MQQAIICKGCWQQMHLPIPLRGLLSFPFRVVGVRPSRMNPNICTICESMFTRIMRARSIPVDVTVMFADLRGYTSLTQAMSPHAMSGMLDAFYDECAAAIWDHDGLLNKTIGDAVMAIFNFPIQQQDHAARALQAARQIQHRWRDRHAQHPGSSNAQPEAPGIGIGIDSGTVTFGEFGRSHRDLTAIGAVVNTASRAQAAARAGEILVTRAVYERARSQLGASTPRPYDLKGIDTAVELYAA